MAHAPHFVISQDLRYGFPRQSTARRIGVISTTHFTQELKMDCLYLARKKKSIAPLR